jgi:hypothetical protein
MLLWFSWILTVIAFPAVADETTEQKIDYEVGFYYTVKQGDTLWDLSQQFSDSPWQWPDLWRENKQLPNPHWIYPGERIRLFRKNDQHRSPALPITPAVTVQTDRPVEMAPPQVDFFFPDIDQVGFIRKPAVVPQGTVFKSMRDKKLISKGDVVYIRYTDASTAATFSPGTRLTVYRTLAPTDERRSVDTIGTQHLLIGLVEVTRTEEQYAIAEVMRATKPILLEDKVMPYEPKSPNFTVVDSTPDVDGTLIVGENHEKLLSTHYVSFIDKGSQDGIVPGQIYHTYKQENVPLSPGGPDIELEPVYTGALFVLHTEPTNATVVITHNIQNITAGDKFHTP